MTTRRHFMKLMLGAAPLMLSVPAAAAGDEPLARKLRVCGLERYQGRVLLPAMRAGDALQLRPSRDEQEPGAIIVYWGEFPIGRVAELDCHALRTCLARGEKLHAEVEEICERPRLQLVFSVWRKALI